MYEELSQKDWDNIVYALCCTRNICQSELNKGIFVEENSKEIENFQRLMKIAANFAYLAKNDK